MFNGLLFMASHTIDLQSARMSANPSALFVVCMTSLPHKAEYLNASYHVKRLKPMIRGEKARGTIKFDFCKSLQCLRLFLPFLKHSAAQSTVSCWNPFLSQIMVNLNHDRIEVMIWKCKAVASSAMNICLRSWKSKKLSIHFTDEHMKLWFAELHRCTVFASLCVPSASIFPFATVISFSLPGLRIVGNSSTYSASK